MLPVSLAFAAIAAIIFIGFFSNMLLKRAGVPEVFFLVAVGLLLGPISGLFPEGLARALIPYFSQFTLAMIMFNIGLELDVQSMVKEGPKAVARTLLYVFLSVAAISIALRYAFGWPLYQSLIMASIVGGETTTTVVPYVARALASRGLYASLSIEAALNSVILIILFSVLLSSYESSIPLTASAASTIASEFFSQLSIGVVLGVAAAALWAKAVRWLGGADYLYIATIGYMLAIYVGTTALGGSGIIAVLTLAFTLSNIRLISDPLSIYLNIPKDLKNYITNFQDELSFFLRTFFYVFLGMVLGIRAFLSPGIYVISLTILGILVAARSLAVAVANRSDSAMDREFIILMMAQGLTPAVLATTLLEYNIPMSREMVMVATLVIIATNLITLAGGRRRVEQQSFSRAPVAEGA